ncbi:MAG TPA: efflux RND transporter periplasmic adaptor subunit [Schlesneria sp.]
MRGLYQMMKRHGRSLSWLIGLVLLAGLGGMALLNRDVQEWIRVRLLQASKGSSGEDANHESDAHQHAAAKGLMLSDRARQNLGLKLGKVEMTDWWRSVNVPAEVIEEPGHSKYAVPSTIQGVVLKIHAFPGQTVRAGDPLVDIQPTGDLLATAESTLLRTIQEIALVKLQLERLIPTVDSGATPIMRRLEKEYELTRLESQRLVQTQELLVRGLTSSQIDEIISTKTLIRSVTIRAPAGDLPGDDVEPADAAEEGIEGKEGSSSDNDKGVPHAKHEHGSVYTVESLNTYLGQLVQQGGEVCLLSRHSHLLLAGRAFEREAHLIARAIEQGWPVKATFETSSDEPLIRDNLSILYADSVINPDTNTIRFYLPLDNEILRDSTGANGLAYRSWRFRPGQKAQLFVPVQQLSRRIVLPADAVVREGAEAYVFRANGSLLERVAVHVESLDSRDAVLANDRALFPGDVVALNQAYQLDLAFKKSQQGSSQGHGHEGHSHEGHSH